ncbi:MAG: histidinol-phosphate aminotransferase, partial [Gammaproteobacteria bacterium]|nr:histidinol-phosphate aminotransferase [Gammaproteobacteria bacterium]
MNDKVKKLIRPEIQALSAYHVADASGLIKLDAMENPYGWPDDMVSDWLA